MALLAAPLRGWLPARLPPSNKYDFGHVLVIGGSQGMMGAPRLAALAALRGGAGLVTLGVPKSLEPIAAGGPWEAMTLALAERSGGVSDRALGTVHPFLRNGRVSCVALGPGLGRRKETVEFVRGFLRSVDLPTVLDADGLNALSLSGPFASETPLILTPHPGEMARLLGTSTEKVQKNRRAAVLEAARRAKAVVVLKGHRSVVSDGDKVYVNPNGNPGMATAGMGDVLAGLIAALYAQVTARDVPERLWRSAVLGVYLHGMAGDLSCRTTGPLSLLATDVISALPQAARRFPSIGVKS